LVLFGFIWPNRGFSMSYGGSKPEFFLPIPTLAAGRLAGGGFDPASGKSMARNSDSRKLLHGYVDSE
jgi:hypothetical protein